MSTKKWNELSKEYYDCKCDYSYTCDACQAIRKQFAKDAYEEKMRDWIAESILLIADRLNIELPEKPKLKSSDYNL